MGSAAEEEEEAGDGGPVVVLETISVTHASGAIVVGASGSGEMRGKRRRKARCRCAPGLAGMGGFTGGCSRALMQLLAGASSALFVICLSLCVCRELVGGGNVVCATAYAMPKDQDTHIIDRSFDMNSI